MIPIQVGLKYFDTDLLWVIKCFTGYSSFFFDLIVNAEKQII